MIVLLKLILAHLLGDFLLQPDRWVAVKVKKKAKAWQLYAHVMIHGLLSMLLIWEPTFWKYALLIIVSHYLIDLAKLYFQQESTKTSWFMADQAMHLGVLLAIALTYGNLSLNIQPLLSSQNLLLMVAILWLTKPVSVVLKVILARWAPHTEDSEEQSLQNAGAYIGILERLFTFIFIIMNHWEAVGFLLAAKSVFRFGDLRESKDRKLTEYILIGTFLSFGIAIITGIIYYKSASLGLVPPEAKTFLVKE